MKTGYDGLINKLKKEEVLKVRALQPSQYFFVTSLPLSRDNKKEIKGIFEPFIISDDHVFGQEDLNEILSNNSSIEERHYKLWICSTTVFNRLINNAIKGRSEFELEQIREKSFKYIQTKNHENALQILEQRNVVIITGEPGVGKTTLAENLCLFYASKGFEFVCLEESISEAENIFAKNKPQVFYFDDFLGSNYFEAIENKKDSHIVKFIDRVVKDNAKRFILTSRTSILNMGMLCSSIFSTQKIDKNEFLLTIESLNKLDRAKILYNHIWFSSLPESYIDEIYKDRRYKEILRHRNFNPRLVQFVTDVNRLLVSVSNEYWSYIIDTMDNPKDVWENSFKVQSNEFVRNLVSLTVFNGGSIQETHLRDSSDFLRQIEFLRSSSNSEQDFVSTSLLATKSFLNRSTDGKQATYALFNPSIADYIIHKYCSDPEKVSNILIALSSTKGIDQLDSLENDGIISSADCIRIRRSLLTDAIVNKRNNDYMIRAIYPYVADKSECDHVLMVLQRIIDTPSPIKEFSRLLKLVDSFLDKLVISDYNFIEIALRNRYPNEKELDCFKSFIEDRGINTESVISEFKQDFIEHLEEKLDSRSDEVELDDFIQNPDDDSVNWFYLNRDDDGIKDELMNILNDILKKHNSTFISSLDIDKDSIVDSINIRNMVRSHVESSKYKKAEPISIKIEDFTDDIDDLFDRN